MSIFPESIEQILGDKMYQRSDPIKVKEALSRLGVTPSEFFEKFYEKYEGPFWESQTGFGLLDMIDDATRNIESYTLIARKEHGFQKHHLVLTDMIALEVLVLDTETDKVYRVNFEGGHQQLLEGKLEASWSTFYDFLLEYFE